MNSVAYVWAKVLDKLEERLSAVTVTSLFDDAETIELTKDHLVLYTPSDFRKEVILRSCKHHIEDILHELFNLNATLIVWNDAELELHRRAAVPENLWKINPHFSFDTFIPGNQNMIPFKVAMHVADNVGDSIYNPLYLYGSPGVGKTHLLYSIANRVSQTNSGIKIVYVKGEQFTNELIQSIQHASVAEFKQKYRDADILLIDDIQFIAGKEATQEEFFHTFNHLHEMHKQIVLTSDRAPIDMPLLADRLRGRFGEGVMLKMEPPDPDTRKQIIKAKASGMHLKFDEETVDYLSKMLCDNVRQIEGGLRKIKAYKDLSDMRLTLDNIKNTIADIRTSAGCTVVTKDTVVRYVCKYYGVDETQLKSPHRGKHITIPRQIAAYLIREMTSCSLDDIGLYFNRDRATIIHAIKKIQVQLTADDGHIEHILQDIRMNIEANT